MSHSISWRTVTCVVALLPVVDACSKGSEGGADSGRGLSKVAAERAAVADTGMPLGATPTAGGVAQVTSTDANSVSDATQYKLTEDNFRRFVAASDSLAALRKRDPATAAFLDQQIADNGNGTRVSGNDAGRKHLESNPAISAAITSTGMSVRDYFVAAIAIAQAERFVGNPGAAPPTPALGPNAQFLKAHQAELTSLRQRQSGQAGQTRQP